jgi:3-hydroxyacyl-CoA dehydrogenase/enoyl-CoA hydratase/3-hydroxybutyryl-CoA epimerase
MMGAGIAYVSAKAGFEVVLKDVTIEAARNGKDYSAKLAMRSVVSCSRTPVMSGWPRREDATRSWGQ